MSTDPASPESTLPKSPPLTAGPVPTRPTQWPMVIGVILIVMASLGLLMYGCGGVINIFSPEMFHSIEKFQPGNPAISVQQHIYQRYLPWNVANAVFMSALSVMLLIAGISMTRRRRSSMRLARLWSVARMLWAIPATYVGWLIMNESFQVMQNNMTSGSNAMPAGFASIMQALGGVGLVIGMIVSCALPVFLLVWFARSTIRNETATWT